MLKQMDRKDLMAAQEAAKAKAKDELRAFLEGAPDFVKKRFDTVPGKYHNLYADALQGKCSTGKAIKAKCLECSSWVREEVRNCNVKLCPLYPIRPFQAEETEPETSI